MKIKEITDIIERFAPLDLQESYDNSGLIVGRPQDEVQRALIAVDVSDEVLDEAVQQGCDLILTHHPLVFHPLRRFNSAGYVERCVERAIRTRTALYACHTNLDSACGGMSWRLARLLGIERPAVLQAAAEGDACTGFGVVGTLPEPQPAEAFLRAMQRRLGLRVIRHSAVTPSVVRRVAVCTGAGGSLIGLARRAGADMYVTSDLRYNDFMEPDGALTVADIGHFESEYCVIDLLYDILSENLINFAVRKSESSRNPVHYLV